MTLRPDHELLVSTWLAGQFAGDGITVVTHLEQGWEDNDLPLVQCSRAGGRPQNSILDQPRFDFDCYVDSALHQPSAASELARVVEALLPGMAGVVVADRDGVVVPGVVTEVGIESGPSWRPDYNPKVHRYGLVASLIVRPSAGPPRPGRARVATRTGT